MYPRNSKSHLPQKKATQTFQRTTKPSSTSLRSPHLMNHGAATKMSSLLLRQLGQRVLSTSACRGLAIETSANLRQAGSVGGFRYKSTLATDAPQEEKGESSKAISSYWGIAPPKITKEDGSAWKWNCFRPWEAYTADVSIDVEKHHKPSNLMDKFAYWTVQTLKVPVGLFFQRRHMCHAMLLETVAAVPGMVGGMLLHCKSLRRFEHSGGWIKALLEEAENERMHLMTFCEIAQPAWYERAIVFAVQGAFFNAYFLAYVVSPKLAHRIVGYLEEEAVISYTEFLKDLDNGSFENRPAPAIAIDYWRLPPDSTLRDVIVVIRADEAHHRDLNHYASDIQCQGQELKEAPAPIGYH